MKNEIRTFVDKSGSRTVKLSDEKMIQYYLANEWKEVKLEKPEKKPDA